MTTYAIGDIQGCQAALHHLLDKINQVSPGARLVFVGDLVNRGPRSLATLKQIIGLGERATVVLGNHDLHLLAAAYGIRQPHKSDTLDDILGSPERDTLLDWLRHRPLAYAQDGFLFVHAGVLPQWTSGQALALAREVETVLRGPDWLRFLAEMYGNQPACWSDSLQGNDRLRCIVNALTRLRFCTPDGEMEFVSKEGADGAPAGYLPWFDVPQRATADVTMVCGHWSTLGLMMRPDLIALDTGCVWGGKLTAVRLEDRFTLQVDCPQYQEPGQP